MRVVDLSAEHEKPYVMCLEDWSDEMKEAGDHKEKWYRAMRDRGLRVKLALDNDGRVGGMIQYLPIEQSPAEGEGLYFVQCIWVHGYKQGRGNFQKRGMGSALLAEAESDARALGAKGMAAWGLILPIWMRARWFTKHGYRKADRQGIRALVWKRFSDDAVRPRWIVQRAKPDKTAGQVTVTAYLNGWCPALNLTYERARRACAEFGDEVVFETIDTFEHSVMHKHGISDGVFVDGKDVQAGPPPSYEAIKKMIAKRVRKL